MWIAPRVDKIVRTRHWRVPRSDSDQSCVQEKNTPRFVGSPKQGAARQRGDYATASALPADPVAPGPEHEASRRSAKGRQFRICFASGMATRGRADSPTKRGDIVSTRKDYRVRSKSAGVQTGMYPCLSPKNRPTFLFPFKEVLNTRRLCMNSI